MTILIATVAAIYTVSLCFVATLLTRALWHDHTAPLKSTDGPTPSGSADTQTSLAELHAAAKSA